ncbi:MAG: AgmX/PglI C-terminal domain-containing protein [Bdellovibrionota bacterium]
MRNLKKLLSKNAAISLLLSANLIAGAYILANKSENEPVVIKAKPKTAHGTIETAAILKNDDRLQACYHSYLEKDPVVDQGSIKLHMTIKYSGEIDYLRLVESDINDEDFKNCILAEVKSRRLTPTRERIGVLISHKFNFSKRTVSSVDY